MGTQSGTALDRYTGTEYANRHPSWHAEDSAWKADRISAMLRRNDFRPASVCEVGCGVGEVLARLQERLPEPASFVGYEVSRTAFERCLPKESDTLQFRLADAAADSQHFELMLLIDVIEHVEDVMGFLRSLRPKSDYTLLHVPLDLSVQLLFRPHRILDIRTATGHLHYFTKELALATLTDAGYRPIDFVYSRGSIELPTRSRKVRLARYPRRALARVNEDLAARLLGGFSLLVLADNAER